MKDLKWARNLDSALVVLTEGIQWVDAFFFALDHECVAAAARKHGLGSRRHPQAGPEWEMWTPTGELHGDGRPTTLTNPGAFRRVGSTQRFTPDEKVQLILHCGDTIDAERAFTNLMWMMATDEVFGRIGSFVGQTSGDFLGRPVGFMTGPAI